MVKKSIIFFGIIFLGYGCKERQLYKRNVQEINTVIFLGLKQKISDSLAIEIVDKGIQTGFNIPAIDQSTNKAEIRIYYFGLFLERFLRQIHSADTVITELYNCKTETRGDSLYMHVGQRISKVESYKWRQFNWIKTIPRYKYLIENREGVADDCCGYLIETKNRNNIKRVLVKYPFNLNDDEDDEEKKQITSVIKSMEDNLGVNITRPWKELLNSALVQ